MLSQNIHRLRFVNLFIFSLQMVDDMFTFALYTMGVKEKIYKLSPRERRFLPLSFPSAHGLNTV